MTLPLNAVVRLLVILGLGVALLGAAGNGGVRAAEQVPASREQIQLTYAPLVRKAAPAVVNIYARKVVRERQRNPLFSDPFFQKFFGDNFGMPFGPPQERVQNSLGSGVIVDPEGVIVTNNHVIEGADEIRIVLRDRREFDAEVVGVDEKTDLAVLHVDPGDEPLPHLEFRDSDDLEVGDLVLAIGNPFGVGQTVTSGIISALARTQVGVSDMGSFIQTDAAINPGNSGGALIAMDGRLVGINTAIFSRSGGSLGIGFAVPSNMVRFVIDSLQEGGKVVRPWLGAMGQPITSDMAPALGLDRPAGVLVNDVWPGSAAERAGVRRGDIIRSVNGRPVNDPRELAYRVGSLKVGGTAELDVVRGGRLRTLSVPLEAAPEDPPRNETVLEGAHPLAGAKVANLSPALVEEVGLDRLKTGVIVLAIARGSPAQRFRFQPGDRILSVNDRKIDSVATLQRAVAGTQAWKIAIDRDGETLTLRIN